MRVFILFTALVLTVVVADGSTLSSPYKCCVSANQYEFMEGIVTGYLSDDDKKGSLSGIMKVSVDNTNKKTAIDENLVDNRKPLKVKVIVDYLKGVQYVITNGNCTVQPAGDYHVCVPADATYNGRFVMGSPSGPFPTDSYSIKGDGHVSTLTVTSEDCYPVGTTIQGHLVDASVTTSVGYFNYTTGISDPSVFDVPSSCPHAGDKDTILFGKRDLSVNLFNRHLRHFKLRHDL